MAIAKRLFVGCNKAEGIGFVCDFSGQNSMGHRLVPILSFLVSVEYHDPGLVGREDQLK